jgi:hypothetical protein
MARPILLQLVLEFIFGFVYHPPCNNVKIQNEVLLKFVTALHVSAYLAIIVSTEIRGHCCVFCATAIGVFCIYYVSKLYQCSSSFYATCIVFFGIPVVCQKCSVDVGDVSD